MADGGLCNAPRVNCSTVCANTRAPSCSWQKIVSAESRLSPSLGYSGSSQSSNSSLPVSLRVPRTGSVPNEMNSYFAVVGSSNGMLKVWTPTTVSPPAVSHKFKSITLDPNIVAGAIVGVARIEQVDPNGEKSLGLLTIAAKGSMCLFRAYTWEPLSLAQVCMCLLSGARAVTVCMSGLVLYIAPRC